MKLSELIRIFEVITFRDLLSLLFVLWMAAVQYALVLGADNMNLFVLSTFILFFFVFSYLTSFFSGMFDFFLSRKYTFSLFSMTHAFIYAISIIQSAIVLFLLGPLLGWSDLSESNLPQYARSIGFLGIVIYIVFAVRYTLFISKKWKGFDFSISLKLFRRSKIKQVVELMCNGSIKPTDAEKAISIILNTEFEDINTDKVNSTDTKPHHSKLKPPK